MAVDIKTLFQGFKTKIGEKLNALNTRINNLPQAGGISSDAGQSLTQGMDSLPFYKTLTDAQIKAANERNANTNPFTDALKQTVEGFTGDLTGKADLDPLTGKLEVSQIPKYSITDVIKPIETTLANFITNVNSYVFDIGDVIIIQSVPDIDGNSTLTHYLYDGEDRSLETSYNEINPAALSSVDWSAITSKPAPVNNLSGINTGDQDLSALSTIVYADNQDAATLQAAKDYSDSLDHADIDFTYGTIALMIAGQNSQFLDDVIKVTDASADANVGAGKAYYFFNGTMAGTIVDYTLLTKAEIDVLTSAKIIAALGITPANDAEVVKSISLNGGTAQTPTAGLLDLEVSAASSIETFSFTFIAAGANQIITLPENYYKVLSVNGRLPLYESEFTPIAPNQVQIIPDSAIGDVVEIHYQTVTAIPPPDFVNSDTISYAISNVSGQLTPGDVYTTFAPYNFTLVTYWNGVEVPPEITNLIFDIKKNGVSITSTKAQIQYNEFTSLTGIAPVLVTTTFLEGDKITWNIFQTGSGETGQNLQVFLKIIKT